MRCVWDEAWVGRCKNDAVTAFAPVGGPALCATHQGKLCVSCGATAVRSCDYTGGFVCGFTLCAECQHGIVMPGEDHGFFRMGGGHVTKSTYLAQMAEYDRRETEQERIRKTEYEHPTVRKAYMTLPPIDFSKLPPIDRERMSRALLLGTKRIGRGQYHVFDPLQPLKVGHDVDLVSSDIPRCDCADHDYRNALCKHIIACLLVERHPVATAALAEYLKSRGQ